MNWIAGVPVALVAAAWLLLPGLAVSYGAGFRGVTAWALAPIATIVEVAGTAVIAGKLGIAWSVPLVLGVCVAVGVLAVGFGQLARRRAVRVVEDSLAPRDSRGLSIAAAAGLAPAVLLGAVTVWRGFGRPDALSQTYDAVFHYNALAFIRDFHNASALAIASLDTSGGPAPFYPAAWHDLTSLVLLTTGTSIPAAANLMVAVIAVVGWPISCLLLVRQVCGPSRLALAVTGLVSVGFAGFPWGLVSFGVLWPNLLGLSIAPAVLAVVLSVCGLAEQDVFGRRRAWLVLLVAVPAMVLAHPNVLFSVAVLAVFPAGVALARRARLLRNVRAVAEILGTLVVFALVWWWAATTPVFAAVRAQYWKPFDTPARAVGEVALNATNGGGALWILSALMFVGVVCAWRVPRWRWLIAGELVSGALYLVTAAHNGPGTTWITGYWYNDSYRLAAMLPLTAVPLVVVAIRFLATRLAGWTPQSLRERAGRRLTGISGVLLVLVAFGLTRGWSLPNTITLVGKHYQAAADSGTALVSDDERAFFTRITGEIPASAVVAGNPYNGSALLWALTDRRTLIPHFNISLTEPEKLLAAHLIDLTPSVCAAANALHVGYLVIGDSPVWMSNPSSNNYPGLADPGQRAGFRLVDSSGPLKLYQVTGCAGT